MEIMRVSIFILIFLAGCATVAEARPKRPASVEVKPPDVVDPADAAAALAAFHRLQAAEIEWREQKRRLLDLYQIDVDQGDGFDADADGKLRARRAPKKEKTK